MAYSLHIRPAARRQIKKLDRSMQARIIRRLEQLAEDPRPPGTTKLTAQDNLFRIREGDYRIIYQIQDKALIVLIAKVAHRADAYRP